MYYLSYANSAKTRRQIIGSRRGGQSLAFHVLSHDRQRLAGLHHHFEQRQQFLQAGQLLFVDQEVGVFRSFIVEDECRVVHLLHWKRFHIDSPLKFHD